MSFVEAAGVTKCVDDAAEIEGIGEIATEAEAVEKAKSFIDFAVFGAEVVNLSGPVRPVGYANMLVLMMLLYWFLF